jgi:hypothetical protein
MEELGGIVHL